MPNGVRSALGEKSAKNWYQENRFGIVMSAKTSGKQRRERRLMIATTYYRSLLSPSEQGVYKDIVAGLLSRKESIYIKQAHAQIESIRKIVNAVHLDRPDLFFCGFLALSINTIIIAVRCILTLSDDD